MFVASLPGSLLGQSQTPTLQTEKLEAIPASNEVLFLEIQSDARHASDFLAQWEKLRGSITRRSVRIDELFVGTDRFYVKINPPRSNQLQRNLLIEALQAEPLVSKVVAASAANAELKNLDVLAKFPASAAIPEGKLRGFREKRVNYKPDLSKRHSGEILVKYLDESSDTAKRSAFRSRVGTIHNRFGPRLKKPLQQIAQGEVQQKLLSSPHQCSSRLPWRHTKRQRMLNTRSPTMSTPSTQRPMTPYGMTFGA